MAALKVELGRLLREGRRRTGARLMVVSLQPLGGKLSVEAATGVDIRGEDLLHGAHALLTLALTVRDAAVAPCDCEACRAYRGRIEVARAALGIGDHAIRACGPLETSPGAETQH